MTPRAIDPDAVDRLADVLLEKATETIALRKRAAALGAGAAAAPLTAVIRWAEGTAGELRVSADLARQATGGDPFGALRLYGLPADLGAVTPGQTQADLRGLQQVLDAHTEATPEARAKAVRAYFATLPPQRQSSFVVTAPHVVGPLDGAPTNVRYAANRVLIQRGLAAEEARLAAMAPGDPLRKRAADRITRMKEFLQTRTVTTVVNGEQVTREVGRQFLVFDPGDDFSGRVAEVFGDLDSAGDVAVTVPGITNRLDNFDSLANSGRQLQAAGGPGTAVVTWLGYDTPELGDAVSPDRAEVGGPLLHSFTAGLNTRDGAALNLFAHSYGTLVSSKALQSGARFDNVVFMGSPGLGPDVNSVADLGLPPDTRVFSMRAPGDYVSYTESHGSDPAEFPDVVRLDTGWPGTQRAAGHSDYYTAKTGSLLNLTSLLQGRGPLVDTATTLGEEADWARPERELIEFMQGEVPPEKVYELGDALDPVLRDITTGRLDLGDLDDAATVAAQVYAALDETDLLDHVTPEELNLALREAATPLVFARARQATFDRMPKRTAREWAAAELAADAAGLAAVGGFEVVNGVVMVGGKVVQVTENAVDAGRVADRVAAEVAEEVERGAGWVGDRAEDVEERARELGRRMLRNPPFGPFR